MIIAGAIVFTVISDPVKAKLDRAFELREQEDYEGSATLFGEIALLYPQTEHADDALFEQGFTYYIKIAPKSHSDSKAVFLKLAGNAFESLLKEYPDSIYSRDSIIYLARINTDLGEHQEAIRHYLSASELIDDLVEKQRIYYEMVRSYEAIEQYEQAVGKLRDIIEIGAPSVHLENSYLTLARYYQITAREQPVDARDAHGSIITLLQEMLSIEQISTTSRRSALLMMAEAYFELDAFDKCEEALKALEGLEQIDATFTLKETDIITIKGYRERIDRRQQMGR